MWIMEKLKDPYGYTLKGVGVPEYYLGADIRPKRVDKDVIDNGVLTLGSTTYVKRCLENYERLLGLKPPKRVSQPLDPKYYPELDTTDIMDIQGRQIYWSLIGMLQWAVTIGRIDIHHAVMMCMSRFRAEPRKGHLQAVSKIFGYLNNYKTASIKFRTGIPDYSQFMQTHKPPTLIGVTFMERSKNLSLKDCLHPKEIKLGLLILWMQIWVMTRLQEEHVLVLSPCSTLLLLIGFANSKTQLKLLHILVNSLLPGKELTRSWQRGTSLEHLEFHLMDQLSCLVTTSLLF